MSGTVDPDSIEVIAYHEAGHALLACLVGAQVDLLTIDPDRDDGPFRFGDAQIRWKVSGYSPREFCEYAIQVALAGPVAEMLYRQAHFHPAMMPEWRLDWEAAWEMGARLFPDRKKRTAYLEQVSLELFRILEREDHWAMLGDIADHLLAHETLEAEQVEEIVSQWH